MSKKFKIATIGGGSSYTPELVEGIIKRYDRLPLTEYWLVDIEEGKEKLEIVGNLAKRMFKEAGIDCEVHLTLDRRAALKDADFVTTQFRVGLLKAREIDEDIALSHGLLGQETNGSGGFGKALRTIPVILDICKDMEELCPNAWLVNFTNPASMVTEAVLNHTNIKAVGVCNVPIGMEMAVSDVLGADPKDFTFRVAGINHYIWAYEILHEGRNKIKEVLEKITDHPKYNPKNISGEWDKSILHKLGMLPCSYHRYYYMSDDMLKHAIEDYKANGTRAQVVQRVEERLFELYKDPNLSHKPEELNERGGAHYSDAACDLIDGLYNNRHNRMVVNLMNNGTISELSDDCIIEATAVITDAGPIPFNVPTLPRTAVAELQTMKAFEKLAVKAAITGCRETALEALRVNPLVPSGEISKTILNEILERHAKYLPQFSK